MAEFRRTFLLAAVMIVISASTANAQNPGTCSGSTASNPLLRSDGQTELTAAISLVCNSIDPSTVTLEITANDGGVPFTSRTGEAMLAIENNGVMTVVPGTIITVSGGSVANNGMRFQGVSITSPNPTILISGIRANVNPAYVPLNEGGFGQVLEEITVSSGVLPITLAGGLFAGNVFSDLGSVTVSGAQASGCGGSITLDAGVNFTVNVPENYPTVFKVQGPSGNSDSETGTIPGALQADSATQLAVSLANLPPGISFYLPLEITSNGSGTAVLVTGPGSTIEMSSGLITLQGVEYAPAIGGAIYYYNVLSTNPSVIQAFSIPLYNSAASFNTGYTPTVTVNLGPAASAAPNTVPRFLGGASAVGLGFSPTAMVSPSFISADSTGGSPQTLSVVTPAPACTWSASTDSSWIQLTPGSGTGSGTVTATLSPNTTGVDRTGSIQIDNANVAVSQAFTPEIFNDVPPTAYYFDAINLLSEKGITSGCASSPPEYCPADNVTRAQMAVFIVRGIYGGDNFTLNSSSPYFNDVPSDAFGFIWIQKMFELGITSGCGNGDFCPNSSVTRAQMAVFIIKARYGATEMFDIPATPYFTDVPPGAFAYLWIQRFRYDNITAGCGPSLFCPNNSVTRGDMAIFIMMGMFNALAAPGTPEILSVAPASIPEGSSTTVTVTGINTNFDASTVVNPIPGVTIGAITVESPTMLTVPLTPATGLLNPPPYSVYVTTSDQSQEEVLPNVLTLQAVP